MKQSQNHEAPENGLLSKVCTGIKIAVVHKPLNLIESCVEKVVIDWFYSGIYEPRTFGASWREVIKGFYSDELPNSRSYSG